MPEVNVSRPNPAGNRLEKMNATKPFHIFSELHALENTEFHSLNGIAQKTFETILSFLQSDCVDEWEEKLKLRSESYKLTADTLLAYIYESEASNLSTSQINLALLSDDNKRTTLEDYDALEKLFNDHNITEQYINAIDEKKEKINEYKARFEIAINNLCKWTAYFYHERHSQLCMAAIENKMRISPSNIVSLFTLNKQSEQKKTYTIEKKDWTKMESLKNIHKVISLYIYSILSSVDTLHKSSYDLIDGTIDTILQSILELYRHDASRQQLEDNYAEWKNEMQQPIDQHYQLRRQQNEDMEEKLEHVYSEHFLTISKRIKADLALITPLKSNADDFFSKLRPILIHSHAQLAELITDYLFAEQFFNIIIKPIMAIMLNQLSDAEINLKLSQLKNYFVLDNNQESSHCFFLPKTKNMSDAEIHTGELLVESNMLDLFILSATFLHQLRPTKLVYDIKFLNGNTKQYQVKFINHGAQLKNSIEFFPLLHKKSSLFVKAVQSIDLSKIAIELTANVPSKQPNIDCLKKLIEDIQKEGKQNKSLSSLFPNRQHEKSQNEKRSATL